MSRNNDLTAAEAKAWIEVELSKIAAGEDRQTLIRTIRQRMALLTETGMARTMPRGMRTMEEFVRRARALGDETTTS